MSNREKAKAYLSMMDEFHSAEDEEDALVGLLDANDAAQRDRCVHDIRSFGITTNCKKLTIGKALAICHNAKGDGK